MSICGAETKRSLLDARKHFQEQGIFHTSEKLAQEMKKLLTVQDITEIYDPTVGAGSLLKIFDDDVKKYGQELDAEMAEYCRQSLVNSEIATGDTLKEPAFLGHKFKAIIANPPYWITATQIYLTAKAGVDIDFLYMILFEQNWKKYTNRYAIPPKLDLEMLLNEDAEIPATVSEQKSLGKVFTGYLRQIELTKKLIEQHEQMKKDIFYMMFGSPNFEEGNRNKLARQCYKLEV